MATRQYIGARYVPVFADPVEWDNTRTYEHLMMVQHQGDTYISQQAVPIGIDLPDTSQGEESNEYWVHMSNWNAQVETYRQEVLAYNGRIAAVENGLPVADFDSENTVSDAIDNALVKLPGTSFDSTNTVKKYIDDTAAVLPATSFDSTNTVKKYIDDTAAVLPATSFDSTNTVKKYIDDSDGEINEKIGSGFSSSNTIASNINVLNNRISGFKDANVLCVTDSWGSESTHGVTKNWMHLVCDQLQANFINLYAGSTGYIAFTAQNGNFLTRVQQYVAAHPDTQIDYIFVCGSSNDYQYTTSDISNAIITFIEWVNANLPNTVIYHFNQFYPANPMCSSVASTTENWWQKVAIGNLNAHVGTPFRKNTVYVYSCINALVAVSNVMDDSVHPNQNGHNVIAKTVMNVLFGGGDNVKRYNNNLRIFTKVGNASTEWNERQFAFNSFYVTPERMNLQMGVSIPQKSDATSSDSVYVGISHYIAPYIASGSIDNSALVIFRQGSTFLGSVNMNARANKQIYTDNAVHPATYWSVELPSNVATALQSGGVDIMLFASCPYNYTATY